MTETLNQSKIKENTQTLSIQEKLADVTRESWNDCVLCGKKIHPYQENSAEPLSEGVCCVSCHYGKVYPTLKNGGVPSRWVLRRDEKGRWKSYIVPVETGRYNPLSKKSR